MADSQSSSSDLGTSTIETTRNSSFSAIPPSSTSSVSDEVMSFHGRQEISEPKASLNLNPNSGSSRGRGHNNRGRGYNNAYDPPNEWNGPQIDVDTLRGNRGRVFRSTFESPGPNAAFSTARDIEDSHNRVSRLERERYRNREEATNREATNREATNREATNREPLLQSPEVTGRLSQPFGGNNFTNRSFNPLPSPDLLDRSRAPGNRESHSYREEGERRRTDNQDSYGLTRRERTGDVRETTGGPGEEDGMNRLGGGHMRGGRGGGRGEGRGRGRSEGRGGVRGDERGKGRGEGGGGGGGTFGGRDEERSDERGRGRGGGRGEGRGRGRGDGRGGGRSGGRGGNGTEERGVGGGSDHIQQGRRISEVPTNRGEEEQSQPSNVNQSNGWRGEIRGQLPGAGGHIRMGSGRVRGRGDRGPVIPITGGLRAGRGIDSRMGPGMDGILGSGGSNGRNGFRGGRVHVSGRGGSRGLFENRNNRDTETGMEKRSERGTGEGGGDVPQLVQEIEEKLTSGLVECMICYETVGRTAPCWSCGSCFAIFHLHCVKKWAQAPSSSATTANTLSQRDAINSVSWRCPGCQSVQNIEAKEIKYRCFCGRMEDPPRNEYFIPHSCGELCQKPLDRSGEGLCPHHCTLQCHPGPCPPCTASSLPQSCHCEKTQYARRCSDRQKGGLSCGKLCGKLLQCGFHSCAQICHKGPCDNCQILVPTDCHCGKQSRSVMCGELLEYDTVEGTMRKGTFSCEVVCGKTLQCGNHTCQKICHTGPCGECELLPSNVKTCPCGKKPLGELLGLKKTRDSCIDPIPTCGHSCSKKLACGIHECTSNCHEGPCGKCTVKVKQQCLCGDSTRTASCYLVNNPEKTCSVTVFENAELFLCEKKCGAKKNCGRHRCSNRCCPMGKNNGQALEGGDNPHLCLLACGKKLQCGQHTCQELCHSGHCPPCLNSVFTELSCACGSTSVPPPVPCGTPPPSCPRDCSVPQPCDHKATHLCHFGPCPPCTVPVAKSCTGGHVVLRGVPCGSRDIKCNNRCGLLRQCGQHFCNRLCHVPPCDSTSGNEASDESNRSSIINQNSLSCGQPCGAQRKDCQHNCVSPCHLRSPCPDIRCQVLVTITCGCGRISVQVPCGAGGGKEPDSRIVLASLPTALQPIEDRGRVPLGQRKLSCDEDCAKMEKRRLLAEAFQPLGSLDGLDGTTLSSSEALMETARKEPQWVAGIEARLQYLVLGPSKGGPGKETVRVHLFKPMPSSKREVVHVLAERWSLGSVSVGSEPRRLVVVYTTSKSRAPSKTVSKGPISLPGQAQAPLSNPDLDLEPSCVVAFFDLPREAKVSNQLLRFGGDCELVWLDDRNALAVFENPGKATASMRYLDYASPYKGASVGRGKIVQQTGNRVRRNTGKESVAEDAWGDDKSTGNWGRSTAGAWQKEGPPIPATGNIFGALGLDRGEAEASSKKSAGKIERTVTEGKSFQPSSLIKKTNFEVLEAEVGEKSEKEEKSDDVQEEEEDWEKLVDQ